MAILNTNNFIFFRMDLIEQEVSEQELHSALIFSPTHDRGERLADLIRSRKDGCEIKIVTDIRDAKRLSESRKYDVVFSLVNGDDCYGMEFMKWLHDNVIGVRRVGVMIQNNISLVNEVYKLGAMYCFYFHSIERDLLAENLEYIFKPDGEVKWFERRSPAFKACGERILMEAKSRGNLLITGEAGTGKCSISRLIHNHSEWRRGKFVIADCSSFKSEDEAYDRFRGAPDLQKTVMYRSQLGLLAQANEGTLMIDHIEKLPLAMHDMIVEIIEKKVYYDIRLKKDMPFSGRFMFTASEDLKERVQNGSFSKRLYFTISQSVMRLPSLSECTDDIIPFAEEFIKEFSQRRNLGIIPKLTEGAKRKLIEHVWSGNIRELYSTISSACFAFRGTTIGIGDIELFEPVDTGYRHSQIFLLKKALKTTRGNVSKAAEILKVDRTTVTRWMKNHKLDRNDFVKD